MSEFEKALRSASTIQLLRIVKSPEDYSEESIAAAKHELANRTNQDEASNRLTAELEVEKNRKAKKAKIGSQISNKTRSAFDLINPVQSAPPEGDKRWKWLTLLFTLISIYYVVNGYSFVKYMFTDDDMTWDPSTIIYILIFFLLPIGTILFYKKTTIGWGLLVVWSLITCQDYLFSAIAMWDYEPAGILGFEIFFSQVSPIQLIGSSLVLGVVILALWHKHIRLLLKIEKQDAIIWTAFGIALPLLSYFF